MYLQRDFFIWRGKREEQEKVLRDGFNSKQIRCCRRFNIVVLDGALSGPVATALAAAPLGSVALSRGKHLPFTTLSPHVFNPATTSRWTGRLRMRVHALEGKTRAGQREAHRRVGVVEGVDRVPPRCHVRSLPAPHCRSPRSGLLLRTLGHTPATAHSSHPSTPHARRRRASKPACRTAATSCSW